MLALRAHARHGDVMPGQMGAHSQLLVHLLEGLVCLAEEVIDDAFAELALDLVLVHLENLLKGGWVDLVFGTRNRHDVAALWVGMLRLGEYSIGACCGGYGQQEG